MKINIPNEASDIITFINSLNNAANYTDKKDIQVNDKIKLVFDASLGKYEMHGGEQNDFDSITTGEACHIAKLAYVAQDRKQRYETISKIFKVVLTLTALTLVVTAAAGTVLVVKKGGFQNAWDFVKDTLRSKIKMTV